MAFLVPFIALEERNRMRIHRRFLRDTTDPFDVPENFELIYSALSLLFQTLGSFDHIVYLNQLHWH